MPPIAQAHLKLCLIPFLGAASLMHAQTPATFDVASVKADPWGGNYRVGVFVHGDTLTAEHTCLYGLVEFAYNLRDDHLSGGPAWAQCGLLASSDLYRVIAKAPGDPPPSTDQFRLMLQTLLADRFQLTVHHVQKDLPICNLVVAPRGPKLKESPTDATFSMHQDARVNRGRSMRVTATHVSMAKLVETFEHFAGRPLFDHTGLSGFYDFEIAWDSESAAADAPDVPAPEAIGQTFSTALEKQLGLKLESGTASFDTVVIDHAGKPSEN
jgi:uncharacterized protein (TIGR03435 family)